jgi:hypothetical protein
MEDSELNPRLDVNVYFPLWKDLSIIDLLALCKTNKYFQEICNRDNTWIFLIKRDFALEYQGSTPRRKYTELCDMKKDRELLNTYKSFVFIDADQAGILYNIIASNNNDMKRVFVEEYLNDKIPTRLVELLDILNERISEIITEVYISEEELDKILEQIEMDDKYDETLGIPSINLKYFISTLFRLGEDYEFFYIIEVPFKIDSKVK